MTTSVTDPRSIRPRPAAWAIASSVGAVTLMAFAQLTQPEVVPSWQPLSELALGPTGWSMSAGFVLLGLACLLLFMALRGQAASRVAHVGRYALLLGASSGVIASAFPTDRWYVDELTTTGTIHSIAPILLDAIPLASILLGVSLVRRSTGWRSCRWWLWGGSAFVVGAAIVLSVSMGVLLPQGGGLGPDVPVGWQGRILVVAVAAWIAIASGCALAVRRAALEQAGAPERASTAPAVGVL